MKFILSLCLVTFSFISFGQNQSDEYIKERDSLLIQMKSEFHFLLNNSPDSVTNYINESLPTYKTDKKIIAWKARLTGLFLTRRNKNDSALIYINKSLNIKGNRHLFQQNKLSLNRIYNSLGESKKALKSLKDLEKKLNKSDSPIIYIELYKQYGNHYILNSDLKKASSYLLSGLEYIDEQNKQYNKQKTAILISLGEVFYSLGEPSKATTHLRKARELAKKLKNKYDLFSIDIKIMNCLGPKSTKLDLLNIENGIKYFEEKPGYKDKAIEAKLTLGMILFLKGETKKTESLFLESLEQSKKSNYNYGIMNSHQSLARYYDKTSQNTKALYQFEESLVLAKKTNDVRQILSSLIGCARINEKLNSYKKAFYYLEEYHSLVKSQNIKEKKESAIELETKYQSEKKQQEIELLTAKSELDAQKQKSQSRTLIGGIILTSLAGIFLFFLYRNRQKTNNKLQEVDLIKTRFFENISHEFRTPLTLIKLPVSNALKTKDSLSAKQLSSIHNNTSRLQNLVEDLLSLSELDTGKMTVNKTEGEPFKQSKILCSQFDSYSSSKGITYTKVIEDKHIIASYDSSVLDKILTNLISNAIKYSNPGDKLTVSISYHSNNFKIKVKDTGLGISEENQQKIFDRFYQVGDKDESIEGSGIGLALVKRILELNNGNIEVESKLNEGSTFTVNLPLEKVHKITQVGPEEQFIKVNKPILIEKEDLVEQIDLGEKPQLLIAEDNLELLEYISSLFHDEFQILTAQNGKEGLEKATEFVPDFIISDWMMPEMNGIDFCEQVKTNSITSHIPFLLLTAKADVKDKIKGYETGADAYFSKPFNMDELKAQINNLISQRKMLIEKYSDDNISSTVSGNSHDIAFWKDFKTHLKNNLSESELSAETIAKELHMSRMQLHRKITALTGQSVSILIRNQRMKLAVQLLEESEYRISEICFEVGYYDNSSFTRTFKKEYGVTPTQYRNNFKK